MKLKSLFAKDFAFIFLARLFSSRVQNDPNYARENVTPRYPEINIIFLPLNLFYDTIKFIH